MRFSQRIGIAPAQKAIQRECVDDDLRNSLWSMLSLYFWKKFEAEDPFFDRDRIRDSNFEQLVSDLWLFYFKKPIDTVEQKWTKCLKVLRDYFFNSEWYEVYDFIEFVANQQLNETNNDFFEVCNKFLERENSAYRFVDGKTVEITSDVEIEEIEAAVENALPFPGVTTHLRTALSLLANKTEPDYRNSIKESISAVESLARKLDNNHSGTLGGLLKSLEKSKRLHPALKNAFSSLYGYTSDAEGIRHGLLDEPNLSKADARFMLVCCSAFINYAIDEIAVK